MLNKFKNTKSYLDGYSKRLIKLLRIEIGRNRTRSYESGRTYSNPIDNTGKLRQSLEFIAKDTKSGFSFDIKGNQYGMAVNDGTKQKSPPIEKIITWIQQKPIRLRDSKGRFVTASESKIRSLAYVISRSIGANGIKKTNFIDDAIEKSMADLSKLGESVGKDVLLNVDDILLKSGYIKKGDNYIIENASK